MSAGTRSGLSTKRVSIVNEWYRRIHWSEVPSTQLQCQDDRQFAGDGDLCLLHAIALGQSQAPSLQRQRLVRCSTTLAASKR